MLNSSDIDFENKMVDSEKGFMTGKIFHASLYKIKPFPKHNFDFMFVIVASRRKSFSKIDYISHKFWEIETMYFLIGSLRLNCSSDHLIMDFRTKYPSYRKKI